MLTWKPGDMVTWRSGEMVTWQVCLQSVYLYIVVGRGLWHMSSATIRQHVDALIHSDMIMCLPMMTRAWAAQLSFRPNSSSAPWRSSCSAPPSVLLSIGHLRDTIVLLMLVPCYRLSSDHVIMMSMASAKLKQLKHTTVHDVTFLLQVWTLCLRINIIV